MKHGAKHETRSQWTPESSALLKPLCCFSVGRKPGFNLSNVVWDTGKRSGGSTSRGTGGKNWEFTFDQATIHSSANTEFLKRKLWQDYIFKKLTIMVKTIGSHLIYWKENAKRAPVKPSWNSLYSITDSLKLRDKNVCTIKLKLVICCDLRKPLCSFWFWS